MIELIQAGGWVMIPLLACSIAALAIILERSWALRRSRVLPPGLVKALHQWTQGGRITHKISQENLGKLAMRSPLGKIVAAALVNSDQNREIVKEGVEDTGRLVIFELERFLNILGTIAAVSPLLGLLGTVFGIIDVFSILSIKGNAEAQYLAGGIAKALVTTAAGLTIAIPTLFFHRYFTGKVDQLVLHMEQEAIRLVDVIHRSQGEIAS